MATRSGVTTRYVYDAAGNLLAEADGAGLIQRYYIYGLGLLAMVDAQTDELFVYHFDGTGHTVAMTNGLKQVVNRYAYSPFGRLLAQDESLDQPFVFAGQVGIMTEPGGLYYMRARYYDAEVGRFISEDPAGVIDDLNLYAYVGGNPLAWVDPTGLGAEPCNGCALPAFSPIDLIGGGVAGVLRGLGPRLAGLLASFSGPKVVKGIVLSGGRSGQNVKNLIGPPNAVLRGGGTRAFVTDKQGRVIKDITRDRVKPVTPGRGFGPKRPPTKAELRLLEKVLGED